LTSARAGIEPAYPVIGMKFSTSQILVFFQERRTQRNIRSLVKFVLILSLLVIGYSILFHFIMEREGQQHSWVTGFY